MCVVCLEVIHNLEFGIDLLQCLVAYGGGDGKWTALLDKIFQEGEYLVVILEHWQACNLVRVILYIVEPVWPLLLIELLGEEFRTIETYTKQCSLVIWHLTVGTAVEEHYGCRRTLPLGLALE